MDMLNFSLGNPFTFKESLTLVTTLPQSPAVGNVYYNPDAGTTMVYTHHGWDPISSYTSDNTINMRPRKFRAHCEYCNGILNITHSDLNKCEYCGIINSTWED